MDDFLHSVKAKVEQADAFDEIRIADGALQCAARGCAVPAFYRLAREEGVWSVSLVTPDRWLSQSIEADLIHTGDPLEERIEEELIDLGHTGGPLPVSHYRSAEMLFTFRSPVPIVADDNDAAVETAVRCLLAYQAAFRALGDMRAAEEP
jgi:hypothetical protein